MPARGLIRLPVLRVKPRSKRRHWWPIFGFCFGVVLLYVSILVRRAEAPLVPGWEGLGRCTFTISFDGTKEFALSYNHQAVLYDHSKKKNAGYPTIKGTWSFDEMTHRYSVMLNDVVTTYSVVAPEQTVACLLVQGDLGAVDMRTSWFSPVIDDDYN
jgi:hypothetical protein